jgi:outer membrane protein TolC
MIQTAHMYQRSAVLFVWILLACFSVSAQDLSSTTSRPLSLPSPILLPLRATFAPVFDIKPDNDLETGTPPSRKSQIGGLSLTANLNDSPAGARRVTLEEAKQMAADASNPMVRLAQLSVEVAKQHRLGVQGLYYPNIGTQFANLHLNKETGFVVGERLGVMVPVNIFEKNQTDFNVAAVQPVTPLLSVYQLVKIARADENIAKAKAGIPVAETAANVEKNFFDLLVAQRELTSAEADAKKIQAKWLTASNTGAPTISSEQETETLGAEKAVVQSTSKVKELTASLNEMLRLPDGTRLELVPPQPLVEDVSLTNAVEKAVANPELIEAEQTAVKAHAGLTLTKLQYVPTVAITGGYANQNAINNNVLPKDFSYIGVIATFTIFDGFKREHSVKEVQAQAEMADMAVQLTKAKVAAGVKSSYFELDRSRQLYQLARRVVSAAQVVDASYRPDNPDAASAQAKMEADMFRAEFEYRQAYAKLKALIGAK